MDRVLHFLQTELSRQKDHIFLWIPVVFGLGIALYFSLPFEPDLWIVCGAFAFLFLGFLITVFYFESVFWRWFFIALLIFSIGFCAASLRTHMIHTPMLEKALGPVILEGRIQEIEILGAPEDRRLLIGDLQVERLQPEETPRLVRLRFRQEDDIQVGDRVSVLVRLMPLSSPVVPGGFDFQRFFYFQGIGAVGFIYKDLDILEPAQGRRGPVFGWIESLRMIFSQRIYTALSPEQAPVAAALMIGERAGISEEDQEAMRGSGLAHMLAISGLHVGLVSGLIFFSVRLGMVFIPGFALHHPIKKYAAAAAMVGAFIYMLLAGAPIPTQRAMLMTGVVLLAIMLDRDPFSLRLVAFAALVVLLFSPESLLSVSFQMSFAAVIALVWFYEQTRQFWLAANRRAGFFKKAMLYVMGICVTTVIASLATAPFALYHFQQFANYSVFANMLAMPLLAFCVMPMAVLSALAMPLGLEGWPLMLMGEGVGLILKIAHYFSSLPGALFLMAMPPFSAFAALVIAGLLCVLVRGRLKAAALIPLVFALSVWAGSKTPDILLSANHKLTAYQRAGAFYLSSLRREKFTAENWERALGIPRGSALAWSEDPDFICDDRGCMTEFEGVATAFSEHPGSHAADCLSADLLIAADPVFQECDARVIDKFDSWRHGAHAVYIQEGRVSIESAGQYRRSRPWNRKAD